MKREVDNTKARKLLWRVYKNKLFTINKELGRIWPFPVDSDLMEEVHDYFYPPKKDLPG